MARLTLSYSDLYTKISEFLGLGSSPTGNDLTLVKDIVARGYRQFLFPIDSRDGSLHEWGFLKQYWTFSTVGSKWKYVLPVDFSDLLDDFHYDSGKGYPYVKRRSAEQIKEMRAEASENSYPEFYAIVPSRYDLEIGTTYEVWFYPTPNQAYVLNTFYRIDPLKPESTTDLLVGGIRATEAILESCLSVAEIQEDDVAGLHTEQANIQIQKLIAADKPTESNYLGNLYSDKSRVWPKDRDLLTDTNISNVYSGD